jgi:lipid II:glycine glycyltransferase (peptidoglycan interpeptide bridge formation enzyme)
VQQDPHVADRDWDAFVAAHACGHLLQSSGWAAFRQAWGWRGRTVALREGERLVAGASVLMRRTPLGEYAYVPRGPVISPTDAAWLRLVEALREAARGALALTLEPAWPDGPEAREALAAAGFAQSAPVQPRSTVCVDLRQTEDDILSAMKQKWRYNIRLAERRGVEIVEGSADDLETFGQLMAVTARRDGFGHRPAGYYAGVWHRFGRDAHLYMARHEHQAIAAILVVHFGSQATYLYGASASTHREHMPNHGLQWHAMRRAKTDGRHWYDFWGIPDEVGLAAARGEALPEGGRGGLWGVWGFKRGFGGEIRRTVGAWTLPMRPRAYRLLQLAGRVAARR